jgi:1,4-dihydroxy-2-naphthoate octaprenyltransferase
MSADDHLMQQAIDPNEATNAVTTDTQPSTLSPQHPLRIWWKATRPRTLGAAVAPVLVGSMLALPDGFSVVRFLLALVGAVAIQAATNMFNEHFDHVQGLDLTRERRADMVVQTGELAHNAIFRYGVLTMALGAACGLVLVALTGPALLVIGVLSVAAAYFYTARPVALGYRALGEVTVFTFMGPVIVMGAYFVQVEHLTWAAFYASVPVGILVANILHANNLRDIRNDRSRGKVTISTMVDRPVADYILWALVIGAFAVVAVCVATGSLTAWTLLVAGAIPAAASTLAMLREQDPMRLNLLVRNSARLHMHFGALLALGLVIEAL